MRSIVDGDAVMWVLGQDLKGGSMFGRKGFGPVRWAGLFMRDFELTGSNLSVEAVLATAWWVIISQADKSLS